jgi:DNA invertase Pin-like site-specific DNA recombinase
MDQTRQAQNVADHNARAGNQTGGIRGRKPRCVSISSTDLFVLRWIARNEDLPQYQVQRARIVLAIAEGARTQRVAREMQCDVATVWRVCRRYEEMGLTGLLADRRRFA